MLDEDTIRLPFLEGIGNLAHQIGDWTTTWPTRAYAQRRRAEGKTNREIGRCLVRYVAPQLYPQLEADSTT